MQHWWTRLFLFFRLRARSNSISTESLNLGTHGEDLAARHLKSLGYKILVRNGRSLVGELDIIARSREGWIVFVEVKTRRDSDPEGGFAAVHPVKQKQLTRTALAYLKREHSLGQKCRFDVIVVTLSESGKSLIHHVPSAFEATGVNSMFS